MCIAVYTSLSYIYYVLTLRTRASLCVYTQTAYRLMHVDQSRSVHLYIYVCACGHPSIFRYMYFVETRVWACICGGCARGCARVGCICL